MEKQPCEHEIENDVAVTVAEVHSENEQVTKKQSAIQEKQKADDESEDVERKSKFLIENQKHSQPAEQSEQEPEPKEAEEVKHQAVTPKVPLLRSNISCNAKSLSLPKVNCKEKIVS